jgi:putative glycosyl hydrolase
MTTRVKPLALILALVALTALALVAALAGRDVQPATAKPRVTVGLGEQRPETFTDPRFRATGIKVVRVVVSYDAVRTGGRRLAELDAYMKTVEAEGLTPLVSFSASSVRSRKKKLPSVRQYTKDVKRFLARYPEVSVVSTFNEANYGRRQPTGRNPKRTAAFYRKLKQACSGCTVLVAEYLANGTKTSKRWLKNFKKALGPGRYLWGLHNYPDPNYFTTRHTRHFLKNTRGNIWITETGGIVRFANVLLPPGR